MNLAETLVPLSTEHRRRFYAEQYAAIGDAIGDSVAAVVTESIADVIAEQFAQGVVDPVAGRAGYQQLIHGDTPAAGADWVYKADGRNTVFPLSVMARLTTDANVANRTLSLRYIDGEGTRFLVAGTQAVVTAGNTQSFCFHPLAGDVAWPIEDAAIAPLPQQMIYPGFGLSLHISNVQAGDQLDQIRLSANFHPTG